MDDLQRKYKSLDRCVDLKVNGEEAIQPDVLLTFPFDSAHRSVRVHIETEEFSAVCPWTGLPDLGKLVVHYIPTNRCIELKSLKYYLLSFRDVGMVQEQAAIRILEDLVRAVEPLEMTVTLDYNIRGGIHTVVSVTHTQTESDHV